MAACAAIYDPARDLMWPCRLTCESVFLSEGYELLPVLLACIEDPNEAFRMPQQGKLDPPQDEADVLAAEAETVGQHRVALRLPGSVGHVV